MQREIKSKDRDRIWVERHRCRGETNRDKLIDTKILRDWQKESERERERERERENIFFEFQPRLPMRRVILR